MLICNGCSKTGTHILTTLAKEGGLNQLGGTLIKRRPNTELKVTSNRLLKEVLALDNQNFIHGHVAYKPFLEGRLIDSGHKMVHIVRNPRNVAISWMRHRNKQSPNFRVSEENLLKIIENKMFGMSVVEYYSGFTGWINSKLALNLKFEEIFEEKKKTVKSFSSYLQLDHKEIDMNKVFGRGSTFTGNWSDWKEWWSQDVEEAWIRSSGIELEEKLGYEL